MEMVFLPARALMAVSGTDPERAATVGVDVSRGGMGGNDATGVRTTGCGVSVPDIKVASRAATPLIGVVVGSGALAVVAGCCKMEGVVKSMGSRSRSVAVMLAVASAVSGS